MSKLNALVDEIMSEVNASEKTAAALDINNSKLNADDLKTEVGRGLLKMAAECRSLAADTGVSYSDMEKFWSHLR